MLLRRTELRLRDAGNVSCMQFLALRSGRYGSYAEVHEHYSRSSSLLHCRFRYHTVVSRACWYHGAYV